MPPPFLDYQVIKSDGHRYVMRVDAAETQDEVTTLKGWMRYLRGQEVADGLPCHMYPAFFVTEVADFLEDPTK